MSFTHNLSFYYCIVIIFLKKIVYFHPLFVFFIFQFNFNVQIYMCVLLEKPTIIFQPKSFFHLSLQNHL